MANQFYGKRYTTLVHMRSSYDCILMKKYDYPPTYAVYDNKKNTEVKIRGFKPTCYDDVYKKAVELNEKEEGK